MATVSYGAISSEVDGSGLVKAKNSETISLTTAGTVMDVCLLYTSGTEGYAQVRDGLLGRACQACLSHHTSGPADLPGFLRQPHHAVCLLYTSMVRRGM